MNFSFFGFATTFTNISFADNSFTLAIQQDQAATIHEELAGIHQNVRDSTKSLIETEEKLLKDGPVSASMSKKFDDIKSTVENVLGAVQKLKVIPC